MPAARNSSAVTQRRGPQRSKQDSKSRDRSERASSGKLSKSQLSSGQSGPRCGRAAATQKVSKKAKGTGNRLAVGGAGDACAWPAYARSAGEAEAEVLAAMRSLYADELKPFGRILRKRVAERILQGSGKAASITRLDALPEVDSRQVRTVCEACKMLRVGEEDGGDWSAVFVDCPETFVDIYSPVDSYLAQLWSALRAYCESSAGKDLSLPGGRYACARTLNALQLPFLAGLSLGRICHIVQLAISQKKIFGYMDGAVVPYARSQSMMKEQCALNGQPTMSSSKGQNDLSALPIASLDVARKHVLDILETANGEAPLSNIKRLFRSRFQIDLSETSFGYSKLSELIQSPYFSDICRVELRGHGYTVIQTGQTHEGSTAPDFRATLLDDGPRRVLLCADEPLAFDDMDALSAGTPMVLVPTPTPTPATGHASRRWCLSPSKDKGDGFVDCSVQHTFLQYKVPQTPLPGPKRRSHSLPKDMGRSRCPLDLENCSTGCNPESSLTNRSLSKFSHDSESTADSSGFEGLQQSSHKRTASGSSTESSNDEASFGYVPQLPGIFWGRTPGTTPLPSPVPKSQVSNAVSVNAWQFPTSLESLCGSLREVNVDDENGIVVSGGIEAAKHRVTFCPDEPLGVDEDGLFPASPKPSSFPTLSPAVVPPTPSPLLYNYSETAPWRRHFMGSSPPQAPPIFNFATAPNDMELMCFGSSDAHLPIQSGSEGIAGLQVPRNALLPGCVIRLGEYL